MGSPHPGRTHGRPAVTSPAPPDIHLDTNFLIRALVAGSAESEALRKWLRGGQAVAISALAWGEFLCRPLEDPVEVLA